MARAGAPSRTSGRLFATGVRPVFALARRPASDGRGRAAGAGAKDIDKQFEDAVAQGRQDGREDEAGDIDSRRRRGDQKFY